jgi:urease beta subunit
MERNTTYTAKTALALTLWSLISCQNAAQDLGHASTDSKQVAYEGQGFKILETGTSKPSSVNYNLHKMTDTVCNPFGGEGPGLFKNGIKAELFWLNSQCPRYENVDDMITHGVKSEKKLFFNDLFTPTRLFAKGFSTQTTETLKNDNGELLVEWFALKFKSGLRLPPTFPQGEYELALLSDDGTKMMVQAGQDMSLLINNDGLHPTRMGCANSFVNLSSNSVLNFELLYAQGPRYHISNVLMWRKVTPSMNSSGQDTSCGMTGNHTFFNPDQNSSVQPAYTALLSRGWTPVPAQAFVIPDEDQYNPCAEGQKPIVSQFRTFEITPTSAIMGWSTDIPATTQIRYRNMTTGEVRLTETDNRLRTTHSIWLTTLAPNTVYAIEVLATSETNGRTVFGPQMISTYTE